MACRHPIAGGDGPHKTHALFLRTGSYIYHLFGSLQSRLFHIAATGPAHWTLGSSSAGGSTTACHLVQLGSDVLEDSQITALLFGN